MNRLHERYSKEVVKALQAKFKFQSPMQVPRVMKVVLNSSVGEATVNPKVINLVVDEFSQISGQKPIITRSKKAISNFKLKQGQPIGVTVTLRRDRMWAFLDRLISVALPRVRDFRGLPTKGFDGRGNYNMGLKEQIVFPEVNYDKVDKVRGFNVTICTSAGNDAEGRMLLEELGLPFRKK